LEQATTFRPAVCAKQAFLAVVLDGAEVAARVSGARRHVPGLPGKTAKR
jgi:hypothetical protein